MKRKKLEAMVTGDRPEIADDIDALRARLKIDRDRLDEEVMEQPQLFHHAAIQYSFAVSRRDEAHEAYKQADADAAARITREMEEREEKVVQARVAQSVKTSPEHVEAYDRYLARCRRADGWEALKEAFKMRAFMLGELTELFTSGYWGDPATRRPSEAAHLDARRRMAEARQLVGTGVSPR